MKNKSPTQFIRQQRNCVLHLSNLQTIPKLQVREMLNRIQIIPDRSRKQNHILWNHREPRPQLIQVNCRDIHIIYQNPAVSDSDNPKQRHCQRRFAASCVGNLHHYTFSKLRLPFSLYLTTSAANYDLQIELCEENQN